MCLVKSLSLKPILNHFDTFISKTQNRRHALSHGFNVCKPKILRTNSTNVAGLLQLVIGLCVNCLAICISKVNCVAIVNCCCVAPIPKVCVNGCYSLLTRAIKALFKQKQTSGRKWIRKVWWQKIDTEAGRLCRKCHGGHVAGEPNKPELMTKVAPPSGPGKIVHVISWGSLPSGEYIFVIVENLSCY